MHKWKIDTYKGAVKLWYGLYRRNWLGFWVRVDFFSTKEGAREAYDREKIKRLPGTPEYLP